MTISEALKKSADIIGDGSLNPQQDAEVLLSWLLKKDRAWLIAHDDKKIENKHLKSLITLSERRSKSEPLAYLIGTQNFYGYPFTVNENVMIPRPETELIIELLTKDFGSDKNLVFADVGTGSGILAITAALLFPEAKVYAFDISNAALEIAALNKKNLKAKNVEIHQSDLLQYLQTNKIAADAVFANLPYLTDADIEESPTKEALLFEPKQALIAEDNGLALIKKTALEAAEVLKAGGKIYFEMLPDQTYEFSAWIKKQNLAYSSQIFKDLTGKDRVVVLSKN